MAIHVEKNVFLVPYWIVNTVERNSLTLNTILDLEKLTSITSAEDLALTSLLNEHSEKIFGVSSYSPSLYSNWYKDQVSWNKFSTQIKPLEQIVFNDLEVRLFNESARNDRYPLPFEIKDVDSNTFLVIIYPGFFGGPDYKQHQFNIIKELLKLFYVYEGYDDMARRQIFEYYINQL